ncbi:MAG: hypothetical protein ACRCWI_00940 [Brevinema sp.]
MYIFLLIFLGLTPNFAQESSNEQLSLKFRGVNKQATIAIIISNRNPIFTELRTIIDELVKDDFRIALVPKDYDYELTQLSVSNNPFGAEVKYVLKIIIHNQSASEQQIKTTVEFLRLSDQKILSSNFTTPRANPIFLSTDIRKMLEQMIQRKNYVNPTIVSVQNNIVVFPKKDFPSLRRGDEIRLRYKESRQGNTESIALVQKISNEMVLAKDLSKKSLVGDEVLRNSPKRNRFYVNVGVIIPTLGERSLKARLDENIWQASSRWSAGFKMEGEYERFLPYQLVSTTTFGINFDRTMHTYLMTGIGYRSLVGTWEFTPYFRLGFAYNAIGLKTIEGTAGDLQGFTLNFGIAGGINIVKRVSDSIFVGLDLGLQYFPLNVVSVLTDSKKIKPEWANKGVFGEKFPITELYPYISLKVGWIF